MKPIYIFLLLMFPYACSMGQGTCTGGNCTNGTGTFKWDDGSEYTGQWVDGKRTGIGVYDWVDGSFYYGFFADGKLEGKGLYIATDSKNDLIGLFHDGKYSESTSIDSVGCILGNCKNGVGVYLWSTADMYVGEYTNDGERTGYGRYDWKNGSIYVGTFKNGKLDGQGDYEGKDGKIMKGPFVDGEFKGTTTYATVDSTEVSPTETLAEVSTVVKEEDFCSVLKDVVKDFPNDFKLFRGRQNTADSDIWDSNIKVTGTQPGVVYSSNAGGLLIYWDNTLYTSLNSNDAFMQYLDYIQKFNDCSLSCGKLEALDTKSNSSEGEFNSQWAPAAGNATYTDMIVELAVKKNYSNGYDVTLTVLHIAD